MVKQPGLVDVLLGDASLPETIKFHEDAKIWALSAGGKTRNPADLLGSNRMKETLQHCRQYFDFIVIDSPPIGPVIDPVIISQLSDAVVYVVAWAATSRELVQQSIQRIPSEKIAGVVLNLVNEKAAQKYGKYAYQYYNSVRSYKKYYEG